MPHHICPTYVTTKAIILVVGFVMFVYNCPLESASGLERSAHPSPFSPIFNVLKHKDTCDVSH